MIYFIQNAITKEVKIGYSKNPEKRLSHLQTASPHKLTLLGAIPGEPEDEAALHTKYASYAIRGEWFKREIIEELGKILIGNGSMKVSWKEYLQAQRRPNENPSENKTSQDLRCPRCNQALRIPTDKGSLVVRCPGCKYSWDWSPISTHQDKSNISISCGGCRRAFPWKVPLNKHGAPKNIPLQLQCPHCGCGQALLERDLLTFFGVDTGWTGGAIASGIKYHFYMKGRCICSSSAGFNPYGKFFPQRPKIKDMHKDCLARVHVLIDNGSLPC